ncbi:Rne/Rng family ribonuclease [Acidicapsa acidisoli]|uniref:Rne/Rng family ribonuclease n=1 Tax=Acidicapsa acidisoli TaxID=1615681 RepID=UPI0021DFE68E|nr:Rne/Rng family ribonuclease [Acidicapsa acidisoli]
MAKEICISSTPHETRLAILEDDQLAEIYYERENEYTLAGSVYKGRVTRVLPGMQSAFVDIGLERDAFLYVTDFLEMEDQEDTDEVERAASQGNTVRQQPAPVQAQQRGDRNGDREQRPRRDGRDGRQAPVEAEPQGQFPVVPVPSAPIESSVIPASVADAVGQQDETDEQGARRWRGRRRRRGGRGREDAGQAGAPESQAESNEIELEETEAPALHFEASASQSLEQSYGAAAAHPEAPVAAEPRPAAPSTPFLLPGESLSKYGAAEIQKPAPSRLILSELPPDTSDPLPERTVAKPSTLVEDEIVWDGKGLFPGESIAKHRQAAQSPETTPSATVDAEPTGVFAAHHTEESAEGREAISHEGVVAEPATFEFSEEISSAPVHHSHQEFEEFEEEVLPLYETAAEAVPEAVHEESEEHAVAVPAEVEAVAEPVAEVSAQDEHLAAHEPEAAAEIEHEEIHDASASHNVDPLPPSSFRLKDLFGGRKKEEEPEVAAPVSAAVPAPRTVPTVSAYAPGEGLVEEEVIEEEEYEFTPLKAHHGDEHDLEELEEETLQQQIRSGALGEMLQEAHLDHRIQLESVDEDESDPDEDEDDAIGAPAGGRGAAPAGAPGRERTGERSGERGGRGRRGRNGGSGGSDSRRGGSGSPGQSRRSAQTSDLPIISDLLKPGQEILVQIAKEPIAKKGARITSHIALPGRFLVFMPTVSHVGVSRKIASDEERQRLKRVLVSEKGDATGGFIVRTAAEGATEEELRADLRFLINLWADIKQRADSSKPPALIYHDLNLIERILRDQISDNFSHIWVDSEADYERIVRFLNRFSPELVRRVKLYTKEVPLFEHFGIQDEISKALRSKVWLKSGGSIVINQTEALVAIDINTGKFVGKTARLEDTILKTNLDAIPEIVRQIRLRDLGGIIVIDFIDMDERKNRTRVMAALEEALKQDRAPTKVLQFNDFGLVAITRKRVKQSLERTLSVPCPVCQATGMVKSAATVANEIYIEMRKMRKHFDQSEVLLRVNPETAKALKANNAKWLTELEDLAAKNVLVKSDATLHPEQFDIQG